MKQNLLLTVGKGLGWINHRITAQPQSPRAGAVMLSLVSMDATRFELLH